MTSYKKWIRVPTYSFYRLEPRAYMKSDESDDKQEEKQEVCFIEDQTDIVRIWMNIFTKYSKNIS